MTNDDVVKKITEIIQKIDNGEYSEVSEDLRSMASQRIIVIDFPRENIPLGLFIDMDISTKH